MTQKSWTESMNPALNPLCKSQADDAPESREDISLTPDKLEQLLRLCRGLAGPSREEDEDSPEDDPDAAGSAEDEDAAEDPDDDEDEDEEDDLPAAPGILRNGKRLPLGKRIYLRQNYNSAKAYFRAVCSSVECLLSKHNLSYDHRTLSDGTRFFLFDTNVRGISFTGHILIDPAIFDIRIEYILDAPMRTGRTALVDHFLTERCFRLRYGKLAMDHSDNERKFEISFCFCGAYAEEIFEQYYTALNYALYTGRDFEDLSSGRRLSTESKRLICTILRDLAENLPAAPKDDARDLYDKAVQALGGEPQGPLKRLLVYLVNRMAS